MFRCAINHLQGGILVFLLKATKQLMHNRQNDFRNTKYKLLKTNAAIWFSKNMWF
jgi:hypothetical protein